MSTHKPKTLWVRYFTIAVVIVSVLVFLALFFIDYGDGTDECHRIGGTTWDYGQHCIVGDFEVYNTN